MAGPRLSPQDHLFAKIRDGTLSFLRLILSDLDAWQAHCRRTAQGYLIPGDPPEPTITEEDEAPSRRGLGLKASYYDPLSTSNQPTASAAGLLFEIIESLRAKLAPADRRLHDHLMIWLASLRANLLKTCEAVHKRHGHALAAIYIAFILLVLTAPLALNWLREALHQMLVFGAALLLMILVAVMACVFCRREGEADAGFLTGALREGMGKTEHSLDRFRDSLLKDRQDIHHALATVRDRLSRQADSGQYHAEITRLVRQTDRIKQRLADLGDLIAFHVRIAGMIQNSLEAETEDKRLNWRPGKGLMAFRNVPKIVWRVRDLLLLGGLAITASWGVAAHVVTDPLSLFAAVTVIGLGAVTAATAFLNLQDTAAFPLSADDLKAIGREEAFQHFETQIIEIEDLVEALMAILKRLLDEENRPR